MISAILNGKGLWSRILLAVLNRFKASKTVAIIPHRDFSISNYSDN